METPKVGQRWYNKTNRSDYIDIRSVGGGMVTGFDKAGADYGRGRPMHISELQKKYTHSQ